MLIRRIARPMLASIFIAGGIDAIRDPHGKAEIAQGFVDKSVETLPDTVTDKVPTEADTLVRVNGAVQVGAGALLAAGKFPRAAALVLAGSTVPTTLAGHAFWEETDPAQRDMQRTQFLKNVSLLGGLLITAVDTEGKPSLVWRSRHKAEVASQALSSALPAGASDSSREKLRSLSQDGAQQVGARSSEAAELVRQRAPEIADRARERSAQAAEVVRQRAPEIADRARERSAGMAELLRQRAPEVAGRTAELAATARNRASESAEEGRRRWREARS